MSNTYRIHGTRYLRKYTAAERSSIYAYMSDVRKIANTLCNVPWTRVGRDIAATTTIHTEEGLDWNDPERERFDAAEWCGEHSDGFHRAFAQAACYVFRLPDSAIGTSIEKIGVQVTSDPYNPYGARISAMTSATLDIPMDCATVREGEVYREPDEDGMGAAPRLFMRNADGSQNWYANTERVELEPETPLTAKKYLFVFCCLENYNRGRDGWIEGSSYIDNDVELTLSAACADLVEDELNDLADAVQPHAMRIVKAGILPYVQKDAPNGIRSLSVRADANPVIESDGTQTPVTEAPGENAAAAVGRLYSDFYAGRDVVPSDAGTTARGASFNVSRTTEKHIREDSTRPEDTDVLKIESSALVVPFSFPREFTPARVLLEYAGLSLSPGARFNVFLADGYLTSLSEEQLKSPGLYDGQGAPFALLGTIDGGTSASFVLTATQSRVGTLVITGWLPPDRFDVVSGGQQGTGSTAFFPDISITD